MTFSEIRASTLPVDKFVDVSCRGFKAGYLHLQAPWKQWTFWPTMNASFSAEELEELMVKMQQLNAEASR